MKYILFLMLLASLSAAGQDSPTELRGTITFDTAYAKPDTSYGSVIMANCAGCMVQARPAIFIRKSYATGQTKIRSWRRSWLFGKIKYHYSLPKKNWVLISFVPCK